MTNESLSRVFGKTNYCHEHGRHVPCEKCNDALVDIGIQADKDRIAWLESEVARLQSLADSGVSLARAVMADQTGRG